MRALRRVSSLVAAAALVACAELNDIPEESPTEACSRCHGSVANPAPPAGVRGQTDRSDRGVGAHQPHVKGGTFSGGMDCVECHVKPHDVDDPDHMDGGPAEITFGGIAASRGAAPRWDPVTGSCSATYCHGRGPFTGGTNQAPQWTTVTPPQATCGSCHGIPPRDVPPHATVPAGDPTLCNRCHPNTVDPATLRVNPATHVDGEVTLGEIDCTVCHGEEGRTPAPPRGTAGEIATTDLAVGAHRAHLADGPVHKAVACAECHVVPTGFAHIQSTAGARAPATLTFGTLATARGASPAWDRAGGTCASVYCHGSTLGRGGSNQTPLWTSVGAGQAACGTCHGVPPPPNSTTGGQPHPQNPNCGSCHPGYSATAVNLDLHVNGVTDVGELTCTSCHGTPGREDEPAPPVGTRGETSPSTRAVGAHQPHLQAGGLGAEVACTECHEVPSRIPHANGRVDITFGPLARTGGASPTFSAAEPSCSSVYCHGEFRGGTPSSPVWPAGSSAAACGSCHRLPPPTGTQVKGDPAHQFHVDREGFGCGECHPSATTTGVGIAASELHVNGRVDVELRVPGRYEPVTQSCNAGTARCHEGERHSWIGVDLGF